MSVECALSPELSSTSTSLADSVEVACGDSEVDSERVNWAANIIVCLNSYSNPICVLPTVTTLPASLGWCSGPACATQSRGAARAY